MTYTTLDKSPDDDMPYDWNFTNEDVFLLDLIATVTVTDWSGAALVGITVTPATIDAVAQAARIVQTRISGGTHGVAYQIKLKATSVLGYDRDAFLLLRVRRAVVPV